MEKSQDDCYFYYYSTCTKGDECPFRHCQTALGSEVTCTHWREGNCMRPNVCKYRHMESRINRSSIQCWFETQPIGCRKPHCVFLHKKPRIVALDDTTEQNNTEGIILPVVAVNALTNSSDTNIDNNSINSTNVVNSINSSTGSSAVKRGDECSKMKLFDDSDYLNQSLSTFTETTNHNTNIEPISISLNDCDEESDNDLMSDNNTNDSSVDNKELELNVNIYNKNRNYGIKTLEQIRMEKVFQHEIDVSVINDNNNCLNSFTKIDSQNKTQKQIKNNKDLRVKIKRRSVNEESKPSVSNSNTDLTPHDFGIKTLDQIRREREVLTNKAVETNDCQQILLKENQEPRGEKRASSDPNSGIIKIRRTGPAIGSSLTNEKSNGNEKYNEMTDNNNENKVTTTVCESNDFNVVTSSNTNICKERIKSIDTDLDDFDFLDGDSTHVDTNAIEVDEDDELMREINQVINS